jgi:hypothetical protein
LRQNVPHFNAEGAEVTRRAQKYLCVRREPSATLCVKIAESRTAAIPDDPLEKTRKNNKTGLKPTATHDRDSALSA